VSSVDVNPNPMNGPLWQKIVALIAHEVRNYTLVKHLGNSRNKIKN